jgi:predicted nucleic acid-binding protein
MKCLDLSVLLYAADTASPNHKRAVELIEQSVHGKWAACVCEQTLHEFSAIVCSPDFAKKPLTSSAASKMVEKLLHYPQPAILNSDEAIIRRAFRLMEKYTTLRHRFSESHVLATMLAHGVKILVTADSQTFSSIREIEMENPFEALFA